MHTPTVISEIAVFVLLLVVLSLLFINPGALLMPMRLDMFATLLLIISFFCFALFYWRELATDEREELHRLQAGRAAFLTGAAVIIAGIGFQTITHNIDPWLILALLSMVSVKLLSRVKSRLKN